MMDGQTLLSPKEQSSTFSSVSVSMELLLCARLCSRPWDTVLRRRLSSWTFSLRQSLSTSALLTSWQDHLCCGAAVLGIMGCLAASLASTCLMPVAQ